MVLYVMPSSYVSIDSHCRAWQSMTLAEAKKLALSTLKAVMQEKIEKSNVEVAVIPTGTTATLHTHMYTRDVAIFVIAFARTVSLTKNLSVSRLTCTHARSRSVHSHQGVYCSAYGGNRCHFEDP